MHEAAFELIEIPHGRQAGKNSADIRMVVDAFDLCYTKEHIDTFVINSGDSDFSPLVSKLRENTKTVWHRGQERDLRSPSAAAMSSFSTTISWRMRTHRQSAVAPGIVHALPAWMPPGAFADASDCFLLLSNCYP